MKNKLNKTFTFLFIFCYSFTFSQMKVNEVFLFEDKCQPSFNENVNRLFVDDFLLKLGENQKLVDLINEDGLIENVYQDIGLMFIVSEKGKITNLTFVNVNKASNFSQQLKEEIISTINSFPKINPAKSEGKIVPFLGLLSFSKLIKDKPHLQDFEVYEYDDNELEEMVIEVPDAIEPESTYENEVFTIVEDMPVFGNCEGTRNEKRSCSNENIKSFIENEVAKYTFEVQGKVFVEFVVDENGNVINETIAKSSYYKEYKELDNAALEIVRKMKDWTPGKQRGKAVKVQYIVPVNFN